MFAMIALRAVYGEWVDHCFEVTLLTSVCLARTIVGTFAFTNNDFKIAHTYDQYGVSIASKASEFKHDHSRLHSTTDQHQANDHVHHGGECHSDICCVGEYLTQVGLVVLVEAVGQKTVTWIRTSIALGRLWRPIALNKSP